ncbi:MAG: TolC family protein [Aquificaceae bacterium]
MWWIVLLLTFGFSFSLSLEELIEAALERNPQVLSKRYALKASQLSLKADEQLYMPEFIGVYKLSFQPQKQSISLLNIQIESSKRSYQSLQLGIRELFYDGGLREGKVSIGKSLLKISEEDLQEAILETKLEVARAYLSVLSALELLEVVKKQKEAILEDLTRRRAFYREGLVAITDVLQAQVRLAEVERDLRQAEGNYRIALANLSRLTGVKEEKLQNLKPLEVIKVEVPSLELLLQKALEKRPLLKMARERIKIQKEQRRVELSNFYPKVFVEAFYNYSDQNPHISPKGFFTLSGGLSFNFQALSSYYRALSLVEEEKKAREEMRDLEEGILLKVRSAYERLLTARDNLRVAEESLRLAEEFYRLSLEQYKNQIISGADLLQAEASLTQARKSRVIAYYELLRSYYELLREVGEL